jgi:hypothetical protein
VKKYSKSDANRLATQKGKVCDPIEITGLFGLREEDLNLCYEPERHNPG